MDGWTGSDHRLMKPRILITTDFSLNEKGRERASTYMSYIDAVQRAGGAPFLAPPLVDSVDELLRVADGIIIPGGDDLDSSLFNEPLHPTAVLMDRRRQETDLAVVRGAIARDIPFLGICLGMQMLGFAAGGRIMQDIPSMHADPIEHRSDSLNRRRHPVIVEGGTLLARLAGAGEAEVNSTHHQAVAAAGESLIVGAHAPDGVIEAIELPGARFCLGVQWHPEDMPGERMSEPLFRALVEAAGGHVT